MAIALGANLGDPAATLRAVRPLLEQRLLQWLGADPHPQGHSHNQLLWSPLFRTEPVGGPADQPCYLNAALVLRPVPLNPGLDAAALLKALQELEKHFGRQRLLRWGPRSLDLDLLWCGPQRSHSLQLQLPHPRLAERSFVLAPLAAIDPALVPPGQQEPCAALLAALLPKLQESPPQVLPSQPGWPEPIG